MNLGEVYTLGNHRLVCGDSTDPVQVEYLMQWKEPELVITDPPYNFITRGGGQWERMKAAQQSIKKIEYMANFKPKAFLDVLTSLFPPIRMNAYIFCNRTLLPDYLNYAVSHKYAYNLLIWKKGGAIPINSSHRPDIEYIVHLRKNAVWNASIAGLNYSKCLEYKRVRKAKENGYHPTVKPLDLIANEIQLSSAEGGIVVDLFGGSGTTLLACEQTNRRCFMMELDPNYCDVIIERWERTTGGTAVKESDTLDSFNLIP